MADQPHDLHMIQAVASKKPLSDRSVNGNRAEILAVRSSRIWGVDLGSSEVTSSAQRSNSSSVPSMIVLCISGSLQISSHKGQKSWGSRVRFYFSTIVIILSKREKQRLTRPLFLIPCLHVRIVLSIRTSTFSHSENGP